MSIGDLKVKEIEMFLDLVASGALRQLAREKGMQPGQLSKMIKGLEVKLQSQLIERSVNGVTTTAKGEELIPYMNKIRTSVDELNGFLVKPKKLKSISMASSSLLSAHLMPTIVPQFTKRQSSTNIRLLELPNEQIRGIALRSGIQVCMHLNEIEWPESWTSVKIGMVDSILVCRVDHPVLENPSSKEVASYPFVYPVFWSKEGVTYGDDKCPVSIKKRVRGYETSSLLSAVEVLKNSDQLAYLPELAVKKEIESGELACLKVRGWKAESDYVYLSVKDNTITKRELEWFTKTCKKELANVKVF